MILQVFLLVVGFVMLIKGADFFVEGAAELAKRLQIPELIIGLTVVAMGTSMPEAAVSITAQLQGNIEITVGNIVGSNILNILIILGASSLFGTLKVSRTTVRYEIPYMIFCSVLLTILGLDGMISLRDGLILWACFLAFGAYLTLGARRQKENRAAEQEKQVLNALWLELVMIAGGLAVLILGSRFSVNAATEIARWLGISERFIGLTVVALGTSLPELFTSVTATRKGSNDIAIGNIVGSNIFNILFIVGTSGLISDVSFHSRFITDSIVMIGAALLLGLGVIRKKEITARVGCLMLICYAGYFAYLCLT